MSWWLQIDSIAQGGRGVARANGYVVFVSGALPGDRVRARLTKAKRNFAEAQAVEMIDPSPDRVPDRCLHDGEPCPGAPWQGLPYERQLDEKSEQIDAALRRLGKLDGFDLEPAEPAAQPWRYRNKLEYSFGERRRPAGARLPPPRQLGGRDRRRGLPAGVGAQQRGAQSRSASGRGARGSPPTTRAARRGCCAISSSARAAAPGSCRPGWSPRRRASPSPRSTCTP